MRSVQLIYSLVVLYCVQALAQTSPTSAQDEEPSSQPALLSESASSVEASSSLIPSITNTFTASSGSSSSSLLQSVKPSESSTTPTITSAPSGPVVGNCPNSCVLSPITATPGNWVKGSISTTITAFTEVLIVNNQTNSTRTSLITNQEVLRGYTIPTETNSDGTRTHKITQSLHQYGINTTWTVTYPTMITNYQDFFLWKGQLSTSAQCESHADYTSQFYPSQSYTPIKAATSQLAPDPADPRGWYHIYGEDAKIENPSSWVSNFPSEEALRSCSLTARDPAKAPAQTFATAAFATITSTSREIVPPDATLRSSQPPSPNPPAQPVPQPNSQSNPQSSSSPRPGSQLVSSANLQSQPGPQPESSLNLQPSPDLQAGPTSNLDQPASVPFQSPGVSASAPEQSNGAIVPTPQDQGSTDDTGSALDEDEIPTAAPSNEPAQEPGQSGGASAPATQGGNNPQSTLSADSPFAQNPGPFLPSQNDGIAPFPSPQSGENAPVPSNDAPQSVGQNSDLSSEPAPNRAGQVPVGGNVVPASVSIGSAMLRLAPAAAPTSTGVGQGDARSTAAAVEGTATPAPQVASSDDLGTTPQDDSDLGGGSPDDAEDAGAEEEPAPASSPSLPHSGQPEIDASQPTQGVQGTGGGLADLPNASAMPTASPDQSQDGESPYGDEEGGENPSSAQLSAFGPAPTLFSSLFGSVSVGPSGTVRASSRLGGMAPASPTSPSAGDTGGDEESGSYDDEGTTDTAATAGDAQQEGDESAPNAPLSTSVFVLGSQTLTAGGAPITVGGEVVSLPLGASSIIVGGSTEAVAFSTPGGSSPMMTPGASASDVSGGGNSGGEGSECESDSTVMANPTATAADIVGSAVASAVTGVNPYVNPYAPAGGLGGLRNGSVSFGRGWSTPGATPGAAGGVGGYGSYGSTPGAAGGVGGYGIYGGYSSSGGSGGSGGGGGVGAVPTETGIATANVPKPLYTGGARRRGVTGFGRGLVAAGLLVVI